MKSNNHMLAIVFAFLTFFTAIQADELHFFISIVRNGIRSPTMDLKTGTESQPTLTPPGMRQQYMLGTYYAQRYRTYYKDFLKKSYEPEKIYVRSSDMDRNLNSAQSLLLGLFPFGTGPNVTGSVSTALVPPMQLSVNASSLGSAAALGNYQPVAIHSTSPSVDFLLRAFSKETCPNLSQNHSNVTHTNSTTTYQNISALVATTAEQIRNTTNISSSVSLDTLEDMYKFYDNLAASHQNGIDTGINQTSELFRTISFLAQFYDLHVNHGSTQLLQTELSPLLTEISSNLNAAKKDKTDLEGAIYLAHDETLSGFLAMLGVTNTSCVSTYYFNNQSSDNNCTGLPEFSSHIELELVTDKSDKWYVIVLYNGAELTPCGGKRCTFDNFQSLISPYIVTASQYQSLCGNIMLQSAPYKQYDYSSDPTVKIKAATSGGGVWGLIVLNLALAAALFVVKKYGRDFVRRKFAQHVPFVGEEQLGEELRPMPA